MKVAICLLLLGPNLWNICAQINLPTAPVRDITDTYFNVQVTDPYRWMEEQGSSEFLSFLERQQEYTASLLAQFQSQRSRLLARLLELQNEVAVVTGAQRIGDEYFYLEAPPGSKDRILMVRNVSGGPARRLLEPARLAESGKHAAITYFQPSWDGKYIVAGVSLGGSEDATLRVIQTSTGEILKDAISRTQYGSPAWTEDNKSFYFMRQQEVPKGSPPTAVYENTRVYQHFVGTRDQSDKAVFGADVTPELKLPKAGFVAALPVPRSSLLLALETRGTIDTPEFWVRAQENGHAFWKQIIRHEDGALDVASRGTRLYVLSNRAPNGRISSFDAARQDSSQGKEILAESDLILTALGDGGLAGAQDALYVYGRRAGKSVILRIPYDQPQNRREIPLLAGGGSVSSVSADYRLPGIIFRMESWTEGPRIYRYDPGAQQTLDTGLQPPARANFSEIASVEVEATSTDGTKVPLTIISRKNLVRNGSHPTILEAYGAYGISITPAFSALRLAWLERDGIVAYAHVRGGGEKGEAWHLAGQKQQKQRTIDDFVACARYLIENGYTSPAHLAARGTSAGGIAVGGFITQHPELLRAALDRVGVSDLLRFETTQGGDANVPEFGSVRVETDFRSLFAISPYHHVKNGSLYPAVLLETGVNDPRVPSWQVAKMAARLQAATSSKLPVLLRVDKDAGHGIGSDRKQEAELSADELTFLGWQLGMPGFTPN